MLKKFISVFVGCILVLSVFVINPITVQARQSGDFKYDVWLDGTAKITQYIGEKSSVIIPSTIDGYTVTIIGTQAFANQSINSVSIPDTVITIEDKAFYRCRNLATVDLDYNYFTKQGVKTIGERAFELYAVTSLHNVIVPPSVTSIGIDAFGYYIHLDASMSGGTTERESWYSMTITGYNDTEAQYYANRNPKVDFISLGNLPSSPTEPPTNSPIRQISDCTINLSQTEYTYDGTEKKPTVTVTDGNKTLNSGTDYTLAYVNNQEVGTATVVVIGIGGYSGTINKCFTIKESKVYSLSDCTITLSHNAYTFDGSEKKPTVSVKDGTKNLILNTDYSVSYKNNINPGTATVTVTGIGNYTGSASRNFVINNQALASFLWGSDNWNFNNSSPIYFKDSTYRDQISKEYLDKLKSNLNNIDYQVIFEGFTCCDAWLDEQWGGSCYGMSSTALLAKNSILPYSTYQKSATKLNDLSCPTKDNNISSLVTYYQMLQVKDVIQQQYRTIPYRSNEQNITSIIELLNQNPVVLIGFQKNDWGGHAILATGYEYGSWTWNGVAYQGCINICDPNASIAFDKNYNIYFNTQSYNWAIPAYNGITSAKGSVFNYIGANIDEINEGGYLSGTSESNLSSFVARIDADAISNNRFVTKVERKNGSYVNRASAPGDIIEDYSFVLGNESKGKVGYNLYDADASYKVSQNDASELQLAIDYQNCNFNVGSKAGNEIVFDPSGYVQVKGDSADYNMSMTFNNNYPTSWFTIQVKGSSAETSSMRKEKNGFILSSDHLTNVSIFANNRDKFATRSFSTDYDSVFIYEINDTTIGLRVDTDKNGTYETELPLIEYVLGDVDGDDLVTITDATTIQKYIAEYELPNPDMIKQCGDVDGDGQITVTDATTIQKYIAEYELPYPIGKPLES